MARSTGSWFARIAAAGVLALVAGCGGGGGGGGGGGSSGSGSGGGSTSGGGSSGAPATPPASSFLTAEFQNQYGLSRINAQSAYARGATGAGVTVAVIDTGIDIDHPDLAANISAASTDIVVGTPATLNDVDGHGTAVAGVIGALKNNVGVHGVAFNSTLLAVRADAVGLCPSVTCGFLETDVAAAVNYAVAQGARVINLSLGAPGASTATLQTALANAAAAGVILVIAAGNDAGANPLSPAALATNPALQGLGIAVGAVDQNNALAAFSNQAGATASAYLVAPGVNIVTTGIGGGYVLATGTSFAAPHVAGAAALLLQLFPSLTPQQVVQLLFNTATDLGAAGDDAAFGQGLLNLALASQPQGTLIVPLANGGSAQLALSALTLGSAFGAALQEPTLMANAVMLDGYGRPFTTDLRRAVSYAGRGFRLDAFLDDSARNVELAPAEGVRLSVASRLDHEAPLRDVLPYGQVEGPQTFESLSLAAELGGGAQVSLGYNLTPGQAVERPEAEAFFWDSEPMLQPAANLLGRGEGVGLSQLLGASTRLSLTVFEGREDEAAGRDVGAGHLAQAGVEQEVGPATLRLSVASVAEDEAFLGGRGEGAFAHGDGAESRFLTLGGSFRLGERSEIFGAWTSGVTEMPEGLGLLGDWDRVRSDSFGLGLAWRDVGEAGDRLGFLVGQPLRVRSAKATLTAPTAMAADGSILFASERVNVAPSGREIDLQASYSHAPALGWLASYYLMMQLEPGHDAEAEPAYGAAIKLRRRF